MILSVPAYVKQIFAARPQRITRDHVRVWGFSCDVFRDARFETLRGKPIKSSSYVRCQQHRAMLLLTLFCGPVPLGCSEALFVDGDDTNLALTNLRWKASAKVEQLINARVRATEV